MNILKIATICVLSIAPLSISDISQSREKHLIDTITGFGHRAFCDAWVIEGNNQKKGDILNWDEKGNLSMKIDGKVTSFYPVSSRKFNKVRKTSTYKSDEFKLKIDSTDISTPKDIKNCAQTYKETVTISSDRWRKVLQLKIGCDPCG